MIVFPNNMCFLCFCNQLGLPMIVLPFNILLYIAAIVLSPLWMFVRCVYVKLNPEQVKRQRQERRKYYKAIREAIAEGAAEETATDMEHADRCREQGIPVLKDVIAGMERE